MVMKKVNPENTGSSNESADAAAGDPQWAEEERGTQPDAAQVTPEKTAAVAAPATKSPALQAKPQALALNSADIAVVKNLKGAFHVAYDSLTSLQATQGRLVERESAKPLGAWADFELMSYQDQYVVSPNDDKAPKEHVRYSEDGIVCSDGTDVKAHLADLKELGYANARVNARYVVVGAILGAEKSDHLNGTLAQIDLSPKSKAQFDRYQVQSAYDLAKGKITAQQAVRVRMTAEVATNAAKQSYTLVKFATLTD